jgi:hypothetical protein
MRAPPTPSSLKWLIDRRTRLSGEITKAKKLESERLSQTLAALAKAQATHQQLSEENLAAIHRHERHVQALSQALEATDIVLREHEIPIDPNDLPSVIGHTTERVGSYSQITRLIYESLGRANGESLSTTQVALYVASRLKKAITEEDFSDFKYRIRKRLSHLTWEGRLDRLHLPKTSVEGRWRLPKSRGEINQEQDRTHQAGGAPASNHATNLSDRS